MRFTLPLLCLLLTVLSAPTSGGKTLVAEILLLRSLMEHKGTMALLVGENFSTVKATEKCTRLYG